MISIKYFQKYIGVKEQKEWNEKDKFKKQQDAIEMINILKSYFSGKDNIQEKKIETKQN